jgi:hypothetical protein
MHGCAEKSRFKKGRPLSIQTTTSKCLTQILGASRFQSSQDGDSGLAQNALDNIVRQTRGVVVKMEQIFLLVITKLLKAVSIRELSERAKMLRLEPFL